MKMDKYNFYKNKTYLENVLKYWFGFFVQWHINHHGLLNTKAILVKKQE